MEEFKEIRMFEGEEFTLRLGDKRKACATTLGNVTFYFDDFRVLEIKNCYYVKNFQRNLISVSQLLREKCCLF